MRYYAEDSDGREKQGGGGEESYHRGFESGLADRFRDALLHRFYVEDRHIGVHRANQGSDFMRERHRVARGAQDYAAAAWKGDVNLRYRGSIESGCLYIRRYANGR